MTPLVALLTTVGTVILGAIVVYAARHYVFAMVRVFTPSNDLYCDIEDADWPTVTVQIAAHNEEDVIAHCLDALLHSSYPRDRLVLMPVNDRSSDRTRQIIDEYAARYPGRITPFHRSDGKPGKAAALKDAFALVRSDLLVVFDADYIPSRGLVKRLVAPFFDPEVGAVMGRVVPLNAGRNLLTRLLEIERSGGYQVNQQARQQLGLVPQYGGTTGGLRVSALRGIGGWHDDTLAEDTDVTYRLLLAGWNTAYQNRAECYEEVPETWQTRIRQIKRWAKGHNQALRRHLWALLRSPRVTLREKIDGTLLLGVYVMAPLLLVAWVILVALYYLGALLFADAVLAMIFIFTYGSLGNFGAFFELSAGIHLDRQRGNARLLPFMMLGFTVSVIAVSASIFSSLRDALSKRELTWHRTERFRKQ
ncbi:MAG: glycosyltransferase family 2 protein [Pseudomonadota bacterium]|nr:glycosyltransferase family 2 protein [Pseudomonadota bacterium]MDQ3160214.1 glycosyltransferase family 2 protein [Pseudomonadota bacterium]